MSALQKEETEFQLSQSVNNALEGVGGKHSSICATKFAEAIFALHPEYAKGKVSLPLETGAIGTRTAGEWLKNIEELFDLDRIRSISSSGQTAWLDGRYVIYGLSLLEPKLRGVLEKLGAFSALEKDIEHSLGAPPTGILTAHGRDLYESSRSPEASKQEGGPTNPIYRTPFPTGRTIL